MVGKPSASLADKIKEDATTLIENNKKHYGPDGLAKLQKEIEDAQAKNDVPVPNEIIRKFPVPDVEGIRWIEVETARANGVAYDESIKNRVQDHVNADKAEPPIFVQYDRTSDERAFRARWLTSLTRQTSTRLSSKFLLYCSPNRSRATTMPNSAPSFRSISTRSSRCRSAASTDGS